VPASVSGIVHGIEGRKGLERAIVHTERRAAYTDSLGRYYLDSLAAGRVRIAVNALGFRPVDTTVAIRAGDRIQWDVSLRPDTAAMWVDYFVEMDDWHWAATVARDSLNGLSGRLDSIARHLTQPQPDRALPLKAFGSRLFATLVSQRGRDSNTIISPLSAGMALSLARFGARGATAEALDRVLDMCELDRPTIEKRGAQMMSDLLRRTDVTLEMANAIWVDTTVTPTPSFGASIATWHAMTASIPLATSKALDAINHWVDSVTHKKINTILSDPLDESARLFIANAVYYKGKWLEPFDKSETQPGDFTLPSGKRITVPRMSRVSNVAYWRASGFQTIRLPYRTGKTAMYIVLPDPGMSFDEVARRLDAADWAPSTPYAEVRAVHLVLPRFHSELALELEDPLRKLGAGIAFDCGRADFSGMVSFDGSARRSDLCIGRALQKAYIDVDEEGAEAAAVTGLTIQLSSAVSLLPSIEFVVDRPFLFVLRDETTGADLFVGRIAHP
jgi:serpin B